MPEEMSMYPEMEKPDAENADEEAQDKGEETGILPMSMFPESVKPGDKCQVEVVAVMDQEVEVKKIHAKSDKYDSEDDMANPVDKMATSDES